MNQADLARVRMRQADACLILASSTARDPSEKDAANIMRVIAVKNYASHVRVIVQLLQTENKSHLLNSPYWNWDGGDEIICFSELKLGFLAQSCMAMGFSTLLTNLFSMRSLKGIQHLSRTGSPFDSVEHFDDPDEKAKTPDHPFSLGAITVPLRRPEQRDQLNASMPKEKETESYNIPFVIVSTTQSGFSTSGSSLNAPSSPVQFDALQPVTQEDINWLPSYLHGVTMEIYSAMFSASFIGFTFAEAAIACKRYLDISLIAVVARKEQIQWSMSELELPRGLNSPDEEQEPSFYLAVSPCLSDNIRIMARTIGFFICESQVDADRVTLYCKHCHTQPVSSYKTKMRSCLCHKKPSSRSKSKKECMSHCIARSESLSPKPAENRRIYNPSVDSAVRQPQIQFGTDDNIPSLDVSGMYYYCEPQSFEESLLLRNLAQSSNQWERNKVVNHILLCLLAEPNSPQLGLHSFVTPLRASNIPKRQLRSIVILGSENYLRQEWPNLVNFPDIYCLPGSPLSPKDLRTARIRFCSICVVLGARGHKYFDDSYMLDKEVILCSLTIRAMTFPPLPANSQPQNVVYRSQGNEIPLITELRTDANVVYLDLDDIQLPSPNVPESLMAPFAKGIVFTSSVLDILASTAYFDRNAMTLIRHLVTGGVTPTLEKWFAEGAGLNGFSLNGLLGTQVGDNYDPEKRREFAERRMACRRRPRVALRSVLEECFRSKSGRYPRTFGTLFCQAIGEKGMLCLGLYRKTHKSTKRPQSVNSFKTPSTSKVPNGSKQINFPRRLSTCAQAVEQVLHEYTLHFQNQWNVPRLSVKTTLDADDEQVNEVLPTQENLQSLLSMSNVLTNRYVITSPPNGLLLQPTDLIFCLCPFESDQET